MSWSIEKVGRPAALQGALDRYEDALTGQSKREYAEVKDALKTLVGAALPEDVLILHAYGHKSYDANGAATAGNIGVKVERLGQLAE